MTAPLGQRVAAEALGSAGLLAVVVGSGIMGERLAGGNMAVALLANAAATAGGLYVLILALAPISGAHFNPLVTIAAALTDERRWRDVLPYTLAQTGGAIAGAWIAHAMFGLALFQVSTKARTGAGQWLGEFVATFGLIACIKLVSRVSPNAVAGAVAAYIGAAYWFTSSTSFANPAATIARALTDTFVGIAPTDVAPFIAAEWIGAVAALAACRWLESSPRRDG